MPTKHYGDVTPNLSGRRAFWQLRPRVPGGWVALGAVLGVLPLGLIFSSAALAAYNDSFSVYTSPACGQAKFTDGEPEYFQITDLCADGEGVTGYLWLNGGYRGALHNGSGAGTTVSWQIAVGAGDSVGIKACLTRSGSVISSTCQSATHKMVDG